MSGFSAEWLALREPVDHRSRAEVLAERVRAAFAGRDRVSVVDLGCGTGSNLRATSLLLPGHQHWTLVDYDGRLLTAARDALGRWADSAEIVGEELHLTKAANRIAVVFRQADLDRDLAGSITPQSPAGATGDGAGAAATADLITASAFFDLCSAPFIARFAESVVRHRAHFYTVLTYNGEQAWSPRQADDAEMTTAFHAHQRTEKGFGAAAGPRAPVELARAFAASGYRVEEGDSPWILAADQPRDETARGDEQRLIDDLASGYAAAVRETGRVTADRIAAWHRHPRTGARVGHTDTLASPPSQA